jgi:hypothetical protein
MTKVWTPEARAAFGAKMAAARAASKAAEAEGATDMAETDKKFAGPEDVPAGVRPIKAGSVARGREIAPEAIAGLTQTADTGFSAPSGGAAVEVVGDVLGGNAGSEISVSPRNTKAGKEKAAGVLFSDRASQGELPAQLRRAGNKVRGHAEPTGLPCSCVSYSIDKNPNSPTYGKKVQQGMATRVRGADPSITWCAVCGGERDGIARPENALKGTQAQQGLRDLGLSVDIEAVASRAAGMVDYDLLSDMVVEKLARAQREKAQ